MQLRHILQYMDSLKTQKSKYLDDETLFFLQIKKNHSLYIIKGYFLAEVTFGNSSYFHFSAFSFQFADVVSRVST